MSVVLKILAIVLGILILLILLVVIGVNIRPKSFPAYAQRTPPLKTVPLPTGLPAPVDRFYRTLYGGQIPVIESVVITGRAQLRPVGPVFLPSRFRFTHVAGRDYRHYIESTIFGIPIFKVNESYLDGQAQAELPWASSGNDPKLNQAANLGLWAEAVWFPSIWITDPRVQWSPVDDQTAILTVPFEDSQERFVARFDPDSGMLHWLESMRYHNETSTFKVLWMNESLEWGQVDGRPILVKGSAIWMDDGKPWAIFTVEDIVYNVDVSQVIRQKGF